MPKQSQRGKATFGGFDFDQFFLTAISEICEHVSPETASFILGGPFSEMHDRVSERLLLAESCLAQGGGPEYIALRQAEALFKKNPDWRAASAEARREKAFEKFFLSEEKCKRTNKRLIHHRLHWSRQEIACEALNRASLIVQSILGTIGPAESEYIFGQCKFGSGATFEHRGDSVNLFSKLTSHHTITEHAKTQLSLYLLHSPSLYRYVRDMEIKTVAGNRLTTVPKDRSVDRMIAIEPAWNVFLQLGCDALMKKKLRKSGVYLRDQGRNYPLAREGSISGDYATIDLSSASDTVSVELVRWLFPNQWFELLDCLRSKAYVTDDGDVVTYEKFSSMGNATTFPIESTIFYAISKACHEICGLGSDDIRVYGDDIIVRREAALLVMEVLRFAGFEPNSSKSFALGPFRETCGRDYLSGLNVRPVYVRGTPTTVEETYSLYNRLLVGSMVPLPRTLRYIRSCVQRPHLGPLFVNSSKDLDIDRILSKESVWDIAKGFRTQNYFVVFDPTVPPFLSKDYQRLSYRIKILDRRFKKLNEDAFTMDTLYRAFLYRLTSESPVNPKRFRYFERFIELEYWPPFRDLVGWQCDSRGR